MCDLHKKHMSLIDAVNNAENDQMRLIADLTLRGWRDGIADAGINLGNMLINADLEQIERGNDVAMCCGVFI
jgi:hypothetical protein